MERFFVPSTLLIFTLIYHMGKVLRLPVSFLEIKDNKQISNDTWTELAEVVLKNNISEFDENTFKNKRGSTIGTKFAPTCAILFMADFEEKMLESFEKKPTTWWRCIDNKFFIREYGEAILFRAS